MPIPQSRKELTDLIKSSYLKVDVLLNQLTNEDINTICVENWTVKELLAVRLWWSERVMDWIETGRMGNTPDIPATGYKWNETPDLNTAIANSSSEESFDNIRNRLNLAYHRILKTIDSLSDKELLEEGVFDWAGKWPISRWLSINTARQYTTAQKYIRNVLKKRRNS